MSKKHTGELVEWTSLTAGQAGGEWRRRERVEEQGREGWTDRCELFCGKEEPGKFEEATQRKRIQSGNPYDAAPVSFRRRLLVCQCRAAGRPVVLCDHRFPSVSLHALQPFHDPASGRQLLLNFSSQRFCAMRRPLVWHRTVPFYKKPSSVHVSHTRVLTRKRSLSPISASGESRPILFCRSCCVFKA